MDGVLDTRRHWDGRYTENGEQGVSWYQEVPRVTLELLDELAIAPGRSVIDVGGGASVVADHLLRRGHTDVTVLDLSEVALETARHRLGAGATRVSWLRHDVCDWQPERTWDVWHDRAVLHFLTSEAQRAAYVATLRRGTASGATVIAATFAPDGPERCSGLPVRRYGPDDLAAVFGDGFETVAVRREEHHTPWGAVQPFTWVALRRL